MPAIAHLHVFLHCYPPLASLAKEFPHPLLLNASVPDHAQVADLGLALVLSMDSDEVQSGIHGTVSHMVRDTAIALRWTNSWL
eukprot:1140635-Pelagomonas_calceolata.AAC.8